MNAVRTPVVVALGCYIARKIYDLVVRPRSSVLAKIPGPRLNSLLGFFGRTEEPELVYDLYKWRDEYGSTFSIDGALGARALMTNDPRALHHITVTNVQKYALPALVRRLISNALGRGLLTAIGAEHRRQRRIFLPAFGDAHVRALAPSFRALAQVLAAKWEEATALGDVELDVHDWMTRFTFDAIGSGGFGVEMHTLDPEVAGTGPNRLCEAFKAHFEQSLGSTLAPVEAALPFLRWLPTTRRRIVDTNEGFIFSEAKRIIDERKMSIADGAEEQRDILSILIKSNTSKDLKPEEILSDQSIAEQAATFMAAGHETSANTLSFAFWYLARYPRVQDKLRAELLECPQLALDALPDECTHTILAGLPYLDAVTNELMRLRPGEQVSLLRAALADDVIPLATPVRLTTGQLVSQIPIRKGDIVAMVPRNADPAVWGEDARDCRPERWFELSAEAEQQPGWNHLVTFGVGSRNCIGLRFALLEFKVCLASVVRELVIRPSPRTADVEPRIKLPMAKPYVKGCEHPQMPLSISRYKA